MSIPEKSEFIELNVTRVTTDETLGEDTIAPPEPKGYSLLDELFLICPSCKKKLVSLVLVKKTDEITSREIFLENTSKEEIFRAKCHKCGVNSFKKTIKGFVVLFQAVPPLSIVDLDTIDNFTEFVVK